MTFSCKLHNMQQIRSYAAAYEWWHANVRYGDNFTPWAPLDGPRKTHVALYQVRDGEAFQCRFYDANLVTYYANGSIEIVTHSTRSSCAFLNNVLPEEVDALTFRGHTHFGMRIDGEILYSGLGATVLYREADGPLQLVTTPPRTQPVVNRERMNEARRLLRPFVQWKRSVDRLSGNSPKKSSITWGPKFTPALGILHLGQSEWPRLLDFTTDSIVFSVAKALKVWTAKEVPLTTPPTHPCITLCGARL